MNLAKQSACSELSLHDWQKCGFAGVRAEEFKALAEAVDEPLGQTLREKHGELSIPDFWGRYERKRMPCIITGIPESEAWPAWSSWAWWTFFERFADSQFEVGWDDAGDAVSVRLDDFEQYMKSQSDDSPIYLFDSQFDSKKSALLQDYVVPSYFPDDYMALAGMDRPPYRWLGVGPRRSGTVMHQDPLCTSAWNTLIAGKKLWLLLPPETPEEVAKARDVMQPGDDEEAEAINHFLDRLPRQRARNNPAFKPMVLVQRAGDSVFIPWGWWHCVVNLEDAIAVTQNYCGRHNFAEVWRKARQERPCWSHRWLRGMEVCAPALAAEAQHLNDEDAFDMAAHRDLNRKRKLRQQEQRARKTSRCACPASDMQGAEAALPRASDEEPFTSDSTACTTSSSSDSDSGALSSNSPEKVDPCCAAAHATVC